MDQALRLTANEESQILQMRKAMIDARRVRFRAVRKCLVQLTKREQKRWKAEYRCGLFVFMKPNLLEVERMIT